MNAIRHTRRKIVATRYQRCFSGTYRMMKVDSEKQAVISASDLTADELPEGIAAQCDAIALSWHQNYVEIRGGM